MTIISFRIYYRHRDTEKKLKELNPAMEIMNA